MANQELVAQQHATIPELALTDNTRHILAAAGVQPSLGRHGSDSPQHPVSSTVWGVANSGDTNASLESQAIASDDSEWMDVPVGTRY